MANGLLSNILNFIDQSKQSIASKAGLLVNNPQEYLAGINEGARGFNRGQEAGLLADRNMMRGLPVTAEQMRAKQFADKQLQEMALGFAGTVGSGARKLPLQDFGEISKFTKPLPAGQLYRETSSSNLMDLFKGDVPFGSPTTYFSEIPEMALGQGANKGVMIKVNSEGLKGRPYLGKPGLDMAYLQKAGEFELKEQPNNIVKAISEVWVSPAAYKDLRKAELVLFNKNLSDLEKNGVKINKVDKLPNIMDVDGSGSVGMDAGKGLLGGAGNIKPVGKTSFDISNEVAQKNAAEMLGLPPNNTAMDRAKAMGFDTDIFHASAKTAPKSVYENGVYLGTIEPELRNLEKVIPNKGGGEGGAFFGSNATDIAKTYAIPTKERAGATYPLKVRSSDFMQSGFNIPMPEGSISQWMKDATIFNRNLDKTKNKYFNEKIKEAKSKGYGGTVFKNVEDAAYDIGSVPMSDIYAINTAPVRSRFAAFDPRRISEPDLLAAGVPLGLLAGTEVELPKKKQSKTKK